MVRVKTIQNQFCLSYVSRFREIAELHKKLAAKESKAQETALSVEMNAKEELRLALERSQQDARRENEGLLLQVHPDSFDRLQYCSHRMQYY